MSDLHKQESIEALKSTLETCNVALEFISSLRTEDPTTALSNHQVLHKDLISLLSLLQGLTTKLSLALKPSSPTYGASWSPIKEISEKISALSHCTRLFNPDSGRTLVEEVRAVVSDVIRSVKALCQTFLDIETSNTRTSTGKAGDEYMVRTAAVHDLIKRAQAPDGLSRDNIVAVRKRLAEAHNSLEDGLMELNEMIDSADMPAQGEGGEEDDFEEDGWEELGIKSERMNIDELGRAQKIQRILRLSTLLHKHIIKDMLSGSLPPSVPLPGHVAQNLDALPSHSSSLLAASDDLISSMYAPQNPSHVAAELALFLSIIKSIRTSLVVLYEGPSSLEGLLEKMDLQSRPKNDPGRWFNTCFDQIQTAAAALGNILDSKNGK